MKILIDVFTVFVFSILFWTSFARLSVYLFGIAADRLRENPVGNLLMYVCMILWALAYLVNIWLVYVYTQTFAPNLSWPTLALVIYVADRIGMRLARWDEGMQAIAESSSC